MERGLGAIELFRKAGIEVAVTPQVFVLPHRVVAECIRFDKTSPNGRFRPSVSYNPDDPKSVERAREAAASQYVPRGTCGKHCNLPCSLRELESPTDI